MNLQREYANNQSISLVTHRTGRRLTDLYLHFISTRYNLHQPSLFPSTNNNYWSSDFFLAPSHRIVIVPSSVRTPIDDLFYTHTRPPTHPLTKSLSISRAQIIMCGRCGARMHRVYKSHNVDVENCPSLNCKQPGLLSRTYSLAHTTMACVCEYMWVVGGPY